MNRPEISITLRIIGDTLDALEVTHLLGCAPSEVHHKGDVIETLPFVGPARTGIWSLSINCIDGDIDCAVADLIGKTTANVEAWHRLRPRYEIDLFCGLFLKTPNQGVSLQPATLRELAMRGIKLSLDIYA